MLKQPNAAPLDWNKKKYFITIINSNLILIMEYLSNITGKVFILIWPDFFMEKNQHLQEIVQSLDPWIDFAFLQVVKFLKRSQVWYRNQKDYHFQNTKFISK